jgi:hypothetical protein
VARFSLSDVSHVTVLVAVMCLTACAVPAEVEGIVSGEEFLVRDPRPASKATAEGRDAYLVLSENDGATMRVVTVRMPDVAAMPLHEDVAVGARDDGSGLSHVEVAHGALLVETRSDGAQILSQKDPQFAMSTAGTIRLDERGEDLSGAFHVDLDDGGYLDGVFVVAAP